MRSSFQFAALLLAATGLPAQDGVTFSTEVKVVNVLASVLNRQGELVGNLEKEDFTLLENGRPQTIQYFARETGLPLTLGLLVDTSMSQERVMDAERAASLQFLDRVLRPNQDQVFVMQFDTGVFLRQPLTSLRKELEDALALVDTPTRKELRAVGGGTRLFDAVVKASNDIMGKRKDRKALILLTDGVDYGSDANSDGAVEAALRSDTLIYSILFTSGYGGTDGRRPLEKLSRETGGGFFEVSKKLPIDKVFAIIEEQLRNQYSLGFVSDQPARFSEMRKLQLATRQKGLVIQTRGRYWAKR